MRPTIFVEKKNTAHDDPFFGIDVPYSVDRWYPHCVSCLSRFPSMMARPMTPMLVQYVLGNCADRHDDSPLGMCRVFGDD